MATLFCSKCKGTSTVQPIRSSEKRIGICNRCFSRPLAQQQARRKPVVYGKKLVLAPKAAM